MLPLEQNVPIYNTLICISRREKIQVDHPKSENVESTLLQNLKLFFCLLKRFKFWIFTLRDYQLVKSMQIPETVNNNFKIILW